METGRDDTAVFCGGGVGVMVLLGFSRRLAKHFATFFFLIIFSEVSM